MGANRIGMDEIMPRAVDMMLRHSEVARETGVWQWQARCYSCGRFVKPQSPGTAWWAGGEFGEETQWDCRACASAPGYRLQAGNGLTDARWCGRVADTSERQPQIPGGHID